MDLIPNYVPSGYKTVNVFLIVKDADKALNFYNSVFGAETLTILRDPNGVVQHAEFKIADTIIMLSEENPSLNLGPNAQGGTSVVIMLYTDDAEAVFDGAVRAGCEIIFPLKEQFYGDKAGRVKDPFGHHWIIARNMETLSPAELQNRFNQLYS